MSTAERLRQFLNTEMKMNHIYQPVIIKGLLEHGGKVTVDQLSEMLTEYLPDENISDLRRKVSKEPKIVLQSHGLAHFESGTYSFKWPIDEISDAERQSLIKLCELKIKSFLTKPIYEDQDLEELDCSSLLNAFLDQARTAPIDLKTKYYPEQLFGFNLAVSFGVGTEAKVPWIAFLGGDQTVQKGIYPAFLFFKKQKVLILSLCQSEKNPSDLSWGNVSHYQTVQEFFSFHEYGLPPRYGNSYVYNAYTIDDTTSFAAKFSPRSKVNIDLIEVLHSYRKILKESIKDTKIDSIQHKPKEISLSDGIKNLQSQIRAAGYHFEPWQIANAVLSLKTKPFAIFAGISGTGKSQLPRLLGDFSGAQVHLIPVRPDWTDSSELLGYTNLQEKFVPGRLLNIAAQAQSEPERMHICVLDEMNLARVEQYFAEVLSLMEDRQLAPTGYRSRNPLHPERPDLFLSDNLLLVGTVNMDETTHGFSKKVLDRAFTLEMSEVHLQHWQGNPSTTSPNTKTWHRSLWQARALRLAELQDLTPAESEAIDQHIALLSAVNRCLQGAQLQIGYRVRDEFCLYLLHAAPLKELFYSEASESLVDPVDLALCMKILPRIQGSALTVQSALENLLQWTLPSDQTIEQSLRAWQAADRPAHWAKAHYPRTASRLLNMLERYQSEGFTSYWL